MGSILERMFEELKCIFESRAARRAGRGRPGANGGYAGDFHLPGGKVRVKN